MEIESPGEGFAGRDTPEKFYRRLFDLYYREMVERAVYYIQDPVASEDLVQELFVRIWEKRAKLTRIENIQGYLVGSIKNSCFNYLKHKRIEDRHLRAFLLRELEEKENDPKALIDKAYRLLEQLPPKRKEVLKLHIIEARSYAEIAEILDISLNTVKDHLKKAHAFLREEAGKKNLP